MKTILRPWAALLLTLAAVPTAQSEVWMREYRLPADSFATRALVFRGGGDVEAEAVDLRLRLVRLGTDKGTVLAPDGGPGDALLRFSSRREVRIVTGRITTAGDTVTTELSLASDPESPVRAFDGRWDFLPDDAGQTTLGLRRLGDRRYELQVINADGSLRAVPDVAGIAAMRVTELVLSDEGGHAAVVTGGGTRIYRLAAGETGGLLYNLPEALWVDLSADGTHAALVQPNAVHVYHGSTRVHVVPTGANVRGTAFAGAWLACVDEATLYVLELASGTVTTHALSSALSRSGGGAHSGAKLTSVDCKTSVRGRPVVAVGYREGAGASAQSSMLVYADAASASAPKAWRPFATPDFEARSPQVRFTADGARLVAYARLEARVSADL